VSLRSACSPSPAVTGPTHRLQRAGGTRRNGGSGSGNRGEHCLVSLLRAVGFWTFLLARAFVGIGEAAYATISPALLSDFYPPEKRNRIITIFYVAIPVGSALGFVLGGYFGDAFGWRAAFLICGLPGLALAALVLMIRDPGRGRYDADASISPPPWMQALGPLLKNRAYVLAVAGYAAVTFASGALADWFPTFLQRCPSYPSA